MDKRLRGENSIDKARWGGGGVPRLIVRREGTQKHFVGGVTSRVLKGLEVRKRCKSCGSAVQSRFGRGGRPCPVARPFARVKIIFMRIHPGGYGRA